MYRKLSLEERQERRVLYRGNPIYRIVYTPLWRQRGEDLSPEDVWSEANILAYKLKNTSNDNCSIIVGEVFDDLCERYSSFSLDDGNITQRTFNQAEHSAMMVSLVAFLLLANVYPEAQGHPYLMICQSLADVASNVNGYKEIYEECRQIEDEYERRGDFVEVADFIEQIAIRETPLPSSEIDYARSVINQIVDENRYFHINTLEDNEVILSRVNDKNNHCFQEQLNQLRYHIKQVKGNDSEQLTYENIVFAKEYENKMADIRRAIYPCVKDGVDHIDFKEQRQWLAIVEPLKLIEGLLVKHDKRPSRKECTDAEICQQMKAFFGNELKAIDFSKIPKSISYERSKWRENNVGLSLQDWVRYTNSRKGKQKYKALASVAIRVYGEVKKTIGR